METDKALEQRLTYIEREINLRFSSQEEAVRVALEAVTKQYDLHAAAHDREHINQEKADEIRRIALEKAEAEVRRALDKAEESLFNRLEITNQWREQYNNQALNFVSKEALEPQLSTLEKEIDALANKTEKEYDNLKELLNSKIAEDVYKEHMKAIDLNQLEFRDWKIQTQSQMKTWAAVVAFIVIAINVAVKYL
jgi:hypothetical protein